MSKEHIAENTLEESSQHNEHGGDPIKELLNGLGDHHDLTVFNHVIAPLPIILYDDGGLHFYSSVHSMEETGDYTMEHHHIVKKSDHSSPDLNLSITNLVFFEVVAAIFLIFIMSKVAGKYKKNPMKAPSGLQNIVESFVTFVRDDIVRANIPRRETADRLTPYFLSIFFFIYVANMIGMIPGGHTPTGNFSVTLALAITAFFVINYTAIKDEGIGHYLAHLTAGTHWSLWILIIPIEIMGMFIKPGVLAIRLFANMTAGHIIMFALIGVIFLYKTVIAGIPITAFVLFIYLIELLVAFLQAFIFTMLTSIFVGLNLSHGESH